MACAARPPVTFNSWAAQHDAVNDRDRLGVSRMLCTVG
jgi:hypothetical protein